MDQGEPQVLRGRNAVVDLIEALILAPQVGTVFAATVVDQRKGHSQVQLVDPPVVASVAAALPVGERVRVRLDAADPGGRTVTFSPA